MLVKDPAQRLGVQDVLSHPWMLAFASGSAPPVAGAHGMTLSPSGRWALSHEGRLDSVAAIKAYQVSVGAAWDWAGHRWGRRRRQHGAGRAPAGSQQQRRAIKALYAEDSLPAPGCF